ncbi:response regulator transcription factor [Alcanivorax sp. 24]|uniref:response regulator n=1 Tax=Alcanivorax sp. 24 TaxID=2545266 RepID=UPI001F0E0068|nr:response regulator transcription factor [Alcanivorax sp. 24]
MGLILEDHDGAQRWLRQVLLDVFPGMTVSTATGLSFANEKLKHLRAAGITLDLALVDLSLPDGTGIDFIRELRRKEPDCLSVVITIHDDDRHVFQALKAGASGYLLKQQSKQELAGRLSGIVNGEPPLSPAIAHRVLATFSQDEEEQCDPMTPREKEVLRLIAKGFTLSKVAETLGVSRHTIAGHVKNIYRKLEVSSRAEATQQAIRLGVI